MLRGLKPMIPYSQRERFALWSTVVLQLSQFEFIFVLKKSAVDDRIERAEIKKQISLTLLCNLYKKEELWVKALMQKEQWTFLKFPLVLTFGNLDRARVFIPHRLFTETSQAFTGRFPCSHAIYRTTFSQFWSSKIHHTTFLKWKNFADLLILRLYICEGFGRVAEPVRGLLCEQRLEGSNPARQYNNGNDPH